MDRTTKRLLESLFTKCVQNDLEFRFAPQFRKMISIVDELSEVSNGYLEGQPNETPSETLNRMHDEVDDYINLPNYEDDDNGPFDADYKTEEARAKLTEQERAMKESGHKHSDFM